MTTTNNVSRHFCRRQHLMVVFSPFMYCYERQCNASVPMVLSVVVIPLTQPAKFSQILLYFLLEIKSRKFSSKINQKCKYHQYCRYRKCNLKLTLLFSINIKCNCKCCSGTAESVNKSVYRMCKTSRE